MKAMLQKIIKKHSFDREIIKTATIRRNFMSYGISVPHVGNFYR